MFKVRKALPQDFNKIFSLYKRVAENSTLPNLKDEAAEKLVKAEAEEQTQSKVGG